MNSRLRNTASSLACLLLVFALALVTHAQELSYRGPLEIGSYEGNVDLTYRFDGLDSVLTGPFSFKSADLNALLAQGDEFFSIEGSFQNNFPSGFWSFRFGSYTGGTESSLVGNRYQVNVSGRQHFAQGRLVQGQPDGPWTHKVELLQDAEITSTPFQSTMEFSKGVPQFSFRISNTESILVGRFLRDGRAHDRWELYGGVSAGVIESWDFNEGRLRSITIQTATGMSSFEIFNKAADNSAIINLDQRYINLLALKRRMMHDVDTLLTSEVYSLLQENISYYQKVDSVLSEISDAEFTPQYKVTVPFYPMDSAEIVQMDSIRSAAKYADEIRCELLEDTQLRLLKLSNARVAFLLSVIDTLDANYLNPLGDLSSYYDQKIMEYVPREELLGMLELETLPKTEISIDMGVGGTENLQVFTCPEGDAWYGKATPLNASYQAAQTLQSSMLQIKTSLLEQLTQKQREEKLAVMEEELIASMNRLSVQTDSLTTVLGGREAGVIQQVEIQANEILKEYALESDPDLKMTRVGELIDCFEDMQNLNTVLASLPEMQLEIDEAYSDAVWNPFTLTIMDEELKRRIKAAYEQILIPYMMEGISNNLDCTNVKEKTSMLEALNARMFELLDEDTKRVERKLRREQDPEVILELFKLIEAS